MKIVVIGAKNSGAKNDPSVLADAAAKNGHVVEVLYWEELVFTITTGAVEVRSGETSIADMQPELVITVGWYKAGALSMYRDVAYSLALYLQSQNITFWSSEMAQQRSTSKLSCMVQLALEGVAVPRTVFSLTTTRATEAAQWPSVVKAVSASRGRSNYLIHSQQELASAVLDDAFYLVQPFLENDHDLRVICFGGEPSMVLRRSRAQDADTHLNNTSQGGSAVWLALDEISPQILTISRKICKIMGREMAGIDFIPDNSSPSGYSCLEVNAIPQLTSGYDVDKKLQAFTDALTNLEKESNSA